MQGGPGESKSSDFCHRFKKQHPEGFRAGPVAKLGDDNHHVALMARPQGSWWTTAEQGHWTGMAFLGKCLRAEDGSVVNYDTNIRTGARVLRSHTRTIWTPTVSAPGDKHMGSWHRGRPQRKLALAIELLASSIRRRD